MNIESLFNMSSTHVIPKSFPVFLDIFAKWGWILSYGSLIHRRQRLNETSERTFYSFELLKILFFFMKSFLRKCNCTFFTWVYMPHHSANRFRSGKSEWIQMICLNGKYLTMRYPIVQDRDQDTRWQDFSTISLKCFKTFLIVL